MNTCESLFLQSLSDKRIDGTSVPGEAFGIGARCDMAHLPASLKAMDYFFTIVCTRAAVELTIDGYSARFGRFHTYGDVFDTDAWEAGKVRLQASPPSRAAYKMLNQAARAALAGRDVYSGRSVELLVAGIRRGGC